MNSAIYEGRVRHRRFAPKSHEFSYRLYLVYLDLDELDSVFSGRWLWSTRRAAPLRFRRGDHLGDAAVPLPTAVRDLVAERTGRRPTGPIRLLTQLSHFGYCFNPVSFYYCFDAAGERIETIVAEVNNTPWGERHCYVLQERMNRGRGGFKRYFPAKAMHVSPFMPMNVSYDWRFSVPDEQLRVHMQNAIDGAIMFDATLDLRRTEISGSALARMLAVFPLMSVKVIAGIYWQALRLWLKGVPVYDHPAKAETVHESEYESR